MKALILTGGAGRSLVPFSATRPKAMSMVAGGSLIRRSLSHLREAGVTDVTVVLGQHGERVKDAFQDGEELGVSLGYIEQERSAGIADAILRARGRFIPGEYFILVYGDVRGETPGEVLSNFLHPAQPGSYIAIQAYIQQNKETDAALGSLRSRLTRQHKLATTVGYGPRFLHSTGQLHKGDAGKGLFIQITSESPDGPRVPNELGSSNASISFGVLVEAEALGDRQALIEAGRRVVRFHIMGDVLESLDYLTEAQSGVAVSFQ